VERGGKALREAKMKKTDLMPVMFFGHGNPMNVIINNKYSLAWEKIGREIPKPKAILSVSAHWYVPYVMVTAMEQPPTIHDFGGFPKKLYDKDYPTPGSPELAKKIIKLLSPVKCSPDSDWGIDHGTWSVLCRAFPKADIPVVQLSIDASKPAKFHFELGKKLAPLREEGVLIIGSGNVVHNLHAFAWGEHEVKPFDWGVRFEKQIKELIKNNKESELADYLKMGDDALMSVPTPDHYLPLLYVMALRQKNEPVTYPVEGFDGGSISMLSVKLG